MLEFLIKLPEQGWFYPALTSLMSFLLLYYATSSFFSYKDKSKWNRFSKIHRRELREEYKKEIEIDAIRKKQDKGILSQIVNALDLRKLLEDKNVNNDLIKAGVFHAQALSIFYFCRLAIPAAFLVCSIIVFSSVSDFGLSQNMQFGAYIGVFALGFYLPTLYVKKIASIRQEKIIFAFPDALDMLLVCVEAGISTEQAFIKVAAEIGETSPDLAEEMALTNAELSYLQDRKQAYHNLAKRNPHAGIRSVATALIQAEKYGTPVGSALRVMVKENRDLRMTTAERKAASLPTKLTVPMILFFMPVIFIVILGPLAAKFLG